MTACTEDSKTAGGTRRLPLFRRRRSDLARGCGDLGDDLLRPLAGGPVLRRPHAGFSVGPVEQHSVDFLNAAVEPAAIEPFRREDIGTVADHAGGLQAVLEAKGGESASAFHVSGTAIGR